MSGPTPASSPTSSPTSSLSSTTGSLTSSVFTALSTSLSSPTPTDLLPSPSISPYPSSIPQNDHATDYDPRLLCDWTRSATQCRDADFTKYILIGSSAAHLLVALFGLWLLYYRNRGFNSRIVTELFIKVGTGLRPKPMDCIIFFTTIASFVKIAGNLILIFEGLLDHMWLRVGVEQVYWIFLAFGFSAYFVGLLYAMPVTTREGIFAVYQPEVVYGSRPLPAIHVLTPTTVQKNVLLILGAVYPTVFGAGLGIASGALHDHGYLNASRVLLLLQYSNWVLILWSMAIMFFYYGLKYTFILRANIIIAEAALKAPRAAFGLGNLKSRSPARFLFIQLQITGFGGAAITVLAGSLCMLWVLFHEQILGMESDVLPHTMAIFWTCLIALAFLILMGLIAAQSIRSRRRGLHEPSTTTTASQSRSKSSNKPAKSTQYDLATGGGANGASGSEARLTQPSSEELGMYRAGMEKDSLDLPHPYQPDTPLQDLSESGHREVTGTNRELWKPASPTNITPPARPRTIQINGNNGQSNIRESVFGGRTPREEPIPVSPTIGQTGGFSFPLISMLSGAKGGSAQPRPSTSSATQTTSTNSNRFSLGSSKHGTSSISNPDSQQLSLPLNYDSSSSTKTPLELQMETERQLQQLQQGSNPGNRVSSQRTRVHSIPENHSPFAEEDSRPMSSAGDPLSFIHSQQQYVHIPSSPSASPAGSRSLRSIPSPIITAVISHQHQAALAREERLPSPPPAGMPTISPSPPSSPGSPRYHPQQDLQLQQQHPLHQVAYTGLSPPPRPPTTATVNSSRRTVTPSPGLSAISTIPAIASSPMATPPSPVTLNSSSQKPYPRSYQARAAGEEEEVVGGNVSPRTFPVGYNDDFQQPRMGGAVRRASNHSNKERDSHGNFSPSGSRLPSSPPMLPQMHRPASTKVSLNGSGGFSQPNNYNPIQASTSGGFAAIDASPDLYPFASMGMPMPPSSAQLHRPPKHPGTMAGPSQQELDQLPLPPFPPQKMEVSDVGLNDSSQNSHHRTYSGRLSRESSGDEKWPMPPTYK